MKKNIISIIHFQKPPILSWNIKCPFLPPSITINQIESNLTEPLQKEKACKE